MWKETLWLNGLRALGAGLVLAVLGVWAGQPAEKAPMIVLSYPVAYYIFFLPAGLVLSWLASIPLVGLFAFFVSLMVAIGDPVVYLLHKINPAWVPVERPSFFSLQIIHFVLLPFDE